MIQPPRFPIVQSDAIAVTTCVLWSLLGTPAAAQEPAAPRDESAPAALETVTVTGRRAVSIGPMPGLDIGKDQLPANVQSANKGELRKSHALNLGDFMNSQMQSVTVNDYAGNPFQMDVNFRGFSASPQIGTPQGLSVFIDGVRVNEPFGDVVNWDLIPLNALERVDLFPGSNPVFGLNTLGGAISVRTRSGFTSPGVQSQLMGGAWGRRQLQFSAGVQDENLAGFMALTRFHEDGWRDNSPSDVNQLYGRADWQGERTTLTGALLLADNTLVGNGLIPQSLYALRPQSVYTSPDKSVNRLQQLSLGGQFDVSDTFNVTVQSYVRRSARRGLNGDAYEGFEDMSIEYDAVFDPDNPNVPAARNGARDFGAGVVEGTPIGLLSRTELAQTTQGVATQLNWNLKQHALLVGAAIDRNRTGYELTQRLGLIDAAHAVYADPDAIGDQYYASANDVPGNNFSGRSTTASLYISDTWTPRPELTLTTSARYNTTTVRNSLLVRSSEGNVDLHELRVNNKNLDQYVFTTSTTQEQFKYTSFNPAVGLNWRPRPDLNLYTNLSRGARVPSVVELGCAFDNTQIPINPADPALGTIARSLRGPGCNLPTTLSGDPYLPQIRATSGELGARGRFTAAANPWDWNLSLFRTDLQDDIYYVGVGDGRSYFDTVGKTRRQGLEMGLQGRAGPVDVKLSYGYTQATFESTFFVASPHNSSADFNQNSIGVGNATTGGRFLPSPTATDNRGLGTYHMIRVDPGARIPGIPAHALNLHAGWQPAPGWKLGLAMQVRSWTYVRGNENNKHRPTGTDQEIGRYYCPAADCTSTGYKQQPVTLGRAFNNPGTLPGYAVFSFDTSLDIRPGMTLFAQVTNLFGRDYATAGRLGLNPFSPSVRGAIGPSGWNYNSSEWQNSTFVGPGAPRAVFVGLNVDFDAPP